VTVILRGGRKRLTAGKFLDRTDRWVEIEGHGRISQGDLAGFVVNEVERVNHAKRAQNAAAKAERAEREGNRRKNKYLARKARR
jgi:hypothetical protein